MYILIITAVFLPEPVVSAKLSFDLASAISTKNKLLVLSPRPTRPYGFEFNNKTVEYSFKHIQTDSYTCPQFNIFGRLKETYSFGKQCQKYITKNRNDISLIYSNTWPLIAQLLTVRAARRNGIPVIVHVQDIYPESLSNKLPFGKTIVNTVMIPIDRYILKNSNKIIVISEKMKDYIAKTRGIKKNKLFVVHNWQDEKPFLEYKEMSDKNRGKIFTFMYLGNLGPVAGIDILIEAFVKAEIDGCRLIIGGSGSVKELLERKAKESKNALIEFWPVPDGKVPEIQSLADVMLLPVKKGATLSSVPSKLIAYMFSKKAILASVDKNSDTANAINVAKCGWISLPENVNELSENMKKIVALSENELELMGMNGFQYAINNYSKKSNIKMLIDLIFETTKK